MSLQEAAEAVLRMKSASATAATGEVPPVYVASNGLTAEDVNKLSQMLADVGSPKIHSLMMAPDEVPGSDDLNFLSHIEMAICVRASRFMKAPGSTWSYNVNALRGNGIEEGMRSAQLLMKRAMFLADVGRGRGLLGA